jgi:MoaA/NifB/PqqE/SkfB family radical SAM enzyme
MKSLLDLEKRFGRIGKDITARFGAQFLNGLNGWQFPEETLKEANQEGKLLTMDLDVPSSCRLNCIYCFAKEDAYYRPQMGDRPLSFEEIKKCLIEAKKLGLQSAKVVGFGEPFSNKNFYDFIDFATEQGIHLVVFTSAYTLGEKGIGGVDKAIEFLAKHDISLMIKFHTLDKEKENSIVGLRGYSKIRDRYLKALIDNGSFTSCFPTRLGLENVIASQDIDELVSIYEYFKIFQNVFVDIDPPIPVGRTATADKVKRIGLSQEKLEELCVKIYKINANYDIPFKGVSSFFGAVPCSQLPNSLYLTLSGKVITCCGGDEEIGNIREQSLTEIFAKNHPYRQKMKDIYHTCPYREKAGILTKEFIEKVEGCLNK